MEKTALEWLEEKLSEFETIQYSLPNGLYEYIPIAKEMEKENVHKKQIFIKEEITQIINQVSNCTISTDEAIIELEKLIKK